MNNTMLEYSTRRRHDIVARSCGRDYTLQRFCAMIAFAILSSLAEAADVLVETATFGYVGERAQYYHVPASADCIVITAWGGGGRGMERFQTDGGSGGKGGKVTASFNVTPGASLEIMVGAGGQNWSSASAWPGGGVGGGGGYSRVRTSVGDVWAGGGGGGGSNSASGGHGGGTGTGLGASGSSAGNATGGGGGTSSQGGSGGTAYLSNHTGLAGGAGFGGNSNAFAPGGGGGGGFYGGGSGTSAYAQAFTYSAGGGGSSTVTGPAYNIVYALADNAGQGGNFWNNGQWTNGGNGGVTVTALKRAGPLAAAVFAANGTNPQTYTVAPSGVGFLAVKAWGTGGAGSTLATGGAGAFLTALYAVTPGQAITITPGAYVYGVPSATKVTLSANSFLVAGGGGAAGLSSSGSGGNGGTPNGATGGTGYGNVGGGGGTAAGAGGAGGQGNGESEETDEEGEGTGNWFPTGLGQPGKSSAEGGAGGNGGESGDNGSYWGGRGGAGYSGGGGGGGGTNTAGGGGGGGGSSVIIAGSPAALASLMQAGSGATAGGSGDPYYPGGGVAQGGVGSVDGGNGAVVIVPFPATGVAPVIANASPPQSWGVGKPVVFTIQANNGPLFFSASALPPGLVLNQVTGAISGSATAGGTYAATVSATNCYGTGQATLTWNIVAADAVAPTAPTNLLASNASLTSCTLTWTASVDSGGIHHYEIRRGATVLGTSTSTSFPVANQEPGVPLSFTVLARDLAGNWSPVSSPLVITFTDIVAPTAPTQIAYVEKTDRSVSLIWTQPADNIGVVSYQVFRDSTLVGTPTEAGFVDHGVAPSTTVSYTVKAADAAGNLSLASAAYPVTTNADAQQDTDGDGVPNVVENALATSASTAQPRDTSNATVQLLLHRPQL